MLHANIEMAWIGFVYPFWTVTQYRNAVTMELMNACQKMWTIRKRIGELKTAVVAEQTNANMYPDHIGTMKRKNFEMIGEMNIRFLHASHMLRNGGCVRARVRCIRRNVFVLREKSARHGKSNEQPSVMWTSNMLSTIVGRSTAGAASKTISSIRYSSIGLHGRSTSGQIILPLDVEETVTCFCRFG